MFLSIEFGSKRKPNKLKIGLESILSWVMVEFGSSAGLNGFGSRQAYMG